MVIISKNRPLFLAHCPLVLRRLYLPSHQKEMDAMPSTKNQKQNKTKNKNKSTIDSILNPVFKQLIVALI